MAIISHLMLVMAFMAIAINYLKANHARGEKTIGAPGGYYLANHFWIHFLNIIPR
jgi:hypothetical protein